MQYETDVIVANNVIVMLIITFLSISVVMFLSWLVKGRRNNLEVVIKYDNIPVWHTRQVFLVSDLFKEAYYNGMDVLLLEELLHIDDRRGSYDEVLAKFVFCREKDVPMCIDMCVLYGKYIKLITHDKK